MYVQYLNNIYYEKIDEKFEILRAIDKKSNMTQRDLSNTLGFSLGKINCALMLLRIKDLQKLEILVNQNKIKYIYSYSKASLKKLN